MRGLLLVTVVGAFLLAASVCWSGIPHLIHYQGMLTDDEGNPLNTPQDISFKIYNDSTGGTLRWTETQYGIMVTEGLFNVNLGDSTPIDLAFDEDYWLEMDVGPGEILTPRVQLTSVGYAYRAETADTADYAQQSAAADSDWTISGSDMYSAVSGNVGIGTTSPATKLDVVGDININSVYRIGGNAVLSADPDSANILVGIGAGGTAPKGENNTFLGDDAGYNNQGVRNTFVGERAGYSNTDGGANTFLGQKAGYGNQSGGLNTFLGASAGEFNTTGSENTFVGGFAGLTNSEGNYNIFIGRDAGQQNKTGSDNIYIGYLAACLNDTSSGNVIIGSNAGASLRGSNNVFIGYKAGHNESGSNKLYIANGELSSNVLISGDFSTGDVLMPNLNYRTAGQAVLWVNDTLYVQSSSRRYKENIRGLDIDPSLIFELDPVRFDWKRTGEEDIGLIAEDVDQVIPDLVIYDGEGKPESVKYDKVAIYLLEVVKELKAENEELKKRMEAIESKE